MRATTSARCLVPGCDWTHAGDPAKVDLEARRHTGEGALGKKPGPKHPTVVESVPA